MEAAVAHVEASIQDSPPGSQPLTTVLVVAAGSQVAQQLHSLLRSQGLHVRVICVAVMKTPPLSANTATSLTGSAFFCWGQYLKAGGRFSGRWNLATAVRPGHPGAMASWPHPCRRSRSRAGSLLP